MKTKRVAAALLLICCWNLRLRAQEIPATPIAPKFKFIFVERIRQESSDNVTSLDDRLADSSSYVRFRTSVGVQWIPNDQIEFFVKLTNENRYYLAPKSDPRLKKNYDLSEVFFDQLFLKWRNPAGLPFTLTAGRQDLMLGEGFLIADGGPLDGSRSFYFNGVRLDWALNPKNTLMFFYVRQPRRDDFLPILNDVGQRMVEQAEEGFGLYFTGVLKNTGVEAYLFRKNIEQIEMAAGSGMTVLGGRLQTPLMTRFSLTAEAALEFGHFGELSRRGLGGYFHLDYLTTALLPWPARLTLGTIYLSGDDPATSSRHEAWDPAFSRWPKWSESLVYLLGQETRLAYWSNMISLYGETLISLNDNPKLLLAWHHLLAAEKAAPSAFLSGEGKSRGDLAIAKLTYDINRNLAGHFIWEYFAPGNFFFAGAQSYAWVRFELLFKF